MDKNSYVTIFFYKLYGRAQNLKKKKKFKNSAIGCKLICEL